MSMIVFINNMFGLANEMLDFVFLWGGLFLLFAFPVYFFKTNLEKYAKEQKSRELLSQAIILFLIITVIGAIWASPEIISLIIILRRGLSLIDEIDKWNEWAWLFSSIRLAMALGAFFFFAYVLGHEHGKSRWLLSALGYIAAVVIGWIVNSWMGILFISIPLITVFYFTLYDLALVVMPVSNPEDRAEQKKRINAFISYTWGIQSPMTMVDDHAWKKYEPRIPGDITWQFADFPIPIIKNLDWRPGLVWTRSHQVVSISGGTKFKRVDGPGVAFPGKLERLDQVFDLRLQLRTREIDVISKDGIRFIARYFTGFRIDNEAWNKDLYDAVRPLNSHLRGADKLSHTQGSFPFSHARVQATLGMTSTKAATGDPTIYWDQWAANVVEDQVRKVLSQKNLDELWRPAIDQKFANALDVIAGEIKKNTELTLRAAGILLVVARVVNFKFPGNKEHGDEITKQQIDTWGSEWARRRSNILAEAQAESDRAQQEARAYAESLLLNSIAEGLQKTHEINPNLPRFVIAMRFLSSLQDYVHKQPVEGEEGEEMQKRIANLQKEFKTWQELYYPGEEK
jgi:hypothetical protein